MMHKFPYESVHEYLREKFDHVQEVTDYMIIEAKKQYAKLYRTYYKAEYKLKHSQITLTFTKNELKRLKDQAKKEHLKLSLFIKNCLSTKSSKIGIDKELIFGMSCLFDLLEESLYERDFEILKEALELLSKLNTRFNDY